MKHALHPPVATHLLMQVWEAVPQRRRRLSRRSPLGLAGPLQAKGPRDDGKIGSCQRGNVVVQSGARQTCHAAHQPDRTKQLSSLAITTQSRLPAQHAASTATIPWQRPAHLLAKDAALRHAQPYVPRQLARKLLALADEAGAHKLEHQAALVLGHRRQAAQRRRRGRAVRIACTAGPRAGQRRE